MGDRQWASTQAGLQRRGGRLSGRVSLQGCGRLWQKESVCGTKWFGLEGDCVSEADESGGAERLHSTTQIQNPAPQNSQEVSLWVFSASSPVSVEGGRQRSDWMCKCRPWRTGSKATQQKQQQRTEKNFLQSLKHSHLPPWEALHTELNSVSPIARFNRRESVYVPQN